LDIEYVYGGYQRKAASRQAHATEDIEGDPEPPRKLVAEVGRPAQSVEDAQAGGIQAAQHDGREDGAPDGDFGESKSHFRFPSDLATSARRLLIHQMPPSRTEPVETMSGVNSSTRQVSAGRGSCGTLVF